MSSVQQQPLKKVTNKQQSHLQVAAEPWHRAHSLGICITNLPACFGMPLVFRDRKEGTMTLADINDGLRAQSSRSFPTWKRKNNSSDVTELVTVGRRIKQLY